MGIFTPSELELDFKLVTFFKEFLGVTQLGLVVMGADFHAKFDFLDLCRGVLAFFFLLGELVLVFAEIGNAANRRIGCGSDFNQVESVGLGPT